MICRHAGHIRQRVASSRLTVNVGTPFALIPEVCHLVIVQRTDYLSDYCIQSERH